MSLQVWMPLNGDIRNYGLNRNVSPFRFEGITFVDGKIGKCAQFPNDAAQFIYMNGLKLQTGSWCAWIKVLGEGAGASQRIISEGRDAGSIGTNIFVSKAGTTLSFTSHKKSIVVNNAITLNKWTHVAATFGNGKLTLYVNGSQVATTTYTEDSDYAQSQDKLVLGKMSYGWTSLTSYFPFNGQMNDFRIYNHALSAKEVHEIAKGLILHYPLNRGGFGNDNLLKSTNEGVGLWAWSANGGSRQRVAYDTIGVKMTTATAANSGSWSQIRYNDTNLKNVLQPNTEYTLSFDACFPNSGNIQCSIRNSNGLEPLTNAQNITVVANKWKHYSCKLTTVNTITISSQIIYLAVGKVAPATTAGISVYFKNLKFELGAVATQWMPNSQDVLYSAMGLDSNTVYDTSGNKYNGITHNITYSPDTPKRDVCSELNANNLSYIMVESNDWMVDKMSDMTINFWASTDDWTEQTTLHLFSCTEGGGFNTEKGNDGYLRFLCHAYTNETGTTAYKYSNTFLKLSDLSSGFHMFTFIYNTTGQKLYIDGELYNTYNATTYGLHFNKNTRLFIGCECNGAGKATAPYATMKVSDFRMYSTTLSADDIAALYHIPISLANSNVLLTNGELVE